MFRLLVLLMCLVLANIACADTFNYTDAAGTLHFVDDPSHIPKKYRKKTKRMKESSFATEAMVNDETSSQSQDEIDSGVVNICLASADKQNSKDYVDFTKYMTDNQIPFTTYDFKTGKRGCLRAYCDYWNRMGILRKEGIAPSVDACVYELMKLKPPPMQLPFFIAGKMLSPTLTHFNLPQ